MRNAFASVLALAAGSLAGAGQDSVVVGGGQRVRVVTAGQRFTQVSIPFTKPAVLYGQLAAVDAGGGLLTATGNLSAGLAPQAAHCLVILDGNQRGEWVYLPPQANLTPGPRSTPRTIAADQALIDPDRSEARLEQFTGHERFSVHPLFRLSELFPPDGSVLPAARLDVLAGQVHLYDTRPPAKYWLSNGEMAAPGWLSVPLLPTATAPEVFLPPATAFVVYHPRPTTSVDIVVAGEVRGVPIGKRILPGFNFVAVGYNLARTDPLGRPSLALQDLRLGAAGFRYGRTPADSDYLLRWDAGGGGYLPARWLCTNLTTPSWRTTVDQDTPVDDEPVDPVRGLVIWHGGSGYSWTDGD